MNAFSTVHDNMYYVTSRESPNKPSMIIIATTIIMIDLIEPIVIGSVGEVVTLGEIEEVVTDGSKKSTIILDY